MENVNKAEGKKNFKDRTQRRSIMPRCNKKVTVEPPFLLFSFKTAEFILVVEHHISS